MFQNSIDSVTFDLIIDQFLKCSTKIKDHKQRYDEMPLDNYLDQQYGSQASKYKIQDSDDDFSFGEYYSDKIPASMNAKEDQQLISISNSQENSSNNRQSYYKFDNALNQDVFKNNVISQNDDYIDLEFSTISPNQSIDLKNTSTFQAASNYQHENQNDHLEPLDLNIVIQRYSKKYDQKISLINTIPLINQIKKKYFLRFDCQESLELLRIQKQIHLKSVKRKDVVLKTTI
ncbi:UNKNOWN [Stylonychia lemnae]|uniref:Uncharacterized protein n=1 Tax=Stylonychia lemnae TaxID=5949 RepID=A0A077ZSZ8_STYLE|nr:UNKNOWN [Stylonychia lemnae]|eukprot:CDW72435.1 UNKNOWN [Stylonychia lemnae]